MQRRQVLGLAGRVGRVGDDAQDGALQRRALEQAAPHQLQVAGRVHAGAHGGAGQQHALVGEQQRQAAGDLDGAYRRHGDGRSRRGTWGASKGAAQTVLRGLGAVATRAHSGGRAGTSGPALRPAPGL